MRYFLINGYRPSPHPPETSPAGRGSTVFFSSNHEETRQKRAKRYHDAGLQPPRLGERCFLKHQELGRLSLFVYGPYDAFLLVCSHTQRKAYTIANAFRCALSIWTGNPPMEQTSGYLLELSSKPTVDMTFEDLCALTQPEWARNHMLDEELELKSGTGLDHPQIEYGAKLALRAIEDIYLLDALLHLDYSRSLVWGFMVSSYYSSHYSRDRRDLTRKQLERIYFETRLRYDSAFISAFRGIESILRRPHFGKNEIETLLESADRSYGTRFKSKRHRSWHEVFSSGRKWWTYSRLIAYYLVLRNAVSAHGNPSSPHIVMEDQVLEIQYLVQSMLSEILLRDLDAG